MVRMALLTGECSLPEIARSGRACKARRCREGDTRAGGTYSEPVGSGAEKLCEKGRFSGKRRQKAQKNAKRRGEILHEVRNYGILHALQWSIPYG